MTFRLALALASLAAAPALAQSQPPADSLPLSQVIAGVEASQPVRNFTEVEWDDDGYWDVEFVTTENRRASIRIDPVTGEPFARRRR
jgi:uncharacterized iron-regulated membrane protein